ncbi:hypothetical protein DQ04_06831010 [Trypanosoma grayi]|uniref:hypothetical protein n=1 Tax=Trypanosoma grayi TaxID=71804 RepID=UPI0004F4806C|nr:hypothetical protein DQ04_06831010 [Trypanosoma grayi]KEG08599.1 hypothetical protein DQ04_06831010 [Trypanosoma grayi]
MKVSTQSLLFAVYFSVSVGILCLLFSPTGWSEGRDSPSIESHRGVVTDVLDGNDSCHHRYAAQPGVPFPCTPRVTRHNHLRDFFRWTDAEELRKAKLLAPVRDFCTGRGVDPFPTVAQRKDSVRGTESLAFLGCGSVLPGGGGRGKNALPAWDYANGLIVPEKLFAAKGGNVLMSTQLLTAEEERAAGVGWSGQWHRCWIIPMTRAVAPGGGRVYEPTCQAGDLVDVGMESATAKVAVERVIDTDDGVLEVQFYIRKRGAYSFCADLLVRHQDMLDSLAASGAAGESSVRLLGRISPSALVEHHGTLGHGAAGPEIAPPLNRTPAYPKNTVCVVRGDLSKAGDASGKAFVRFDHGVDVVPLPVRCDAVDDFDRFRFGGWYRVGHGCDGVHCVALGVAPGAPHPLLKETEGWVWASDVCQMRLFTDKELLLSLLQGEWLLAWGPSTTQEPLADMLEERLHTTIFSEFMRDIWKVPKEKLPKISKYRMWDRCVSPDSPWSKRLFRKARETPPSTRVTLLWGGCMKLTSHKCLGKCGLFLFQERLNHTIGAAAYLRQRAPPPCGSKAFPTALLLDHVVWRCHASQTDPAFLLAMRNLLLSQLTNLYEEVVNASSAHDPAVAQWPLTIWHTAPAGNNADKGRRDGNYDRARVMHLQWAMEDDLAAVYRLPEGNKRVVQGAVVVQGGARVTYIADNNQYPPLTAKRVRQRRAGYNVTRGLAVVPPVVVVSRHQITLPLHFGNEFCRNGMHYGSTPGQCLTATKEKNAEYHDCVRKTWADKALQVVWWNAVSRDKQRRLLIKQDISM